MFYLDIIVNEHLSYEITATTLAEFAGRALGGVISKLYHSGVVPVMDYCT